MTQGIQIAVPMSDDFRGNWTPKELADHVNKQPPIVSGVNPQGDACQMKLKPVAWPGPGAETLAVTLSGDGATFATVVLKQVWAVIAAQTFTPPSMPTTYILTLTDAQVAQITDYTQLDVELIAGNVTVPCCANPMPHTLSCTFSNPSGTCACLDGVTLTLSWDSANNGWVGSFVACGSSATIMTLVCADTIWTLGGAGVAGSCLMVGSGLPTVSGCGIGTTLIVFTEVVIECCAGNVTATITG